MMERIAPSTIIKAAPATTPAWLATKRSPMVCTRAGKTRFITPRKVASQPSAVMSTRQSGTQRLWALTTMRPASRARTPVMKQRARADELLHQARIGLSLDEHPRGHADADDEHQRAHQPRDISRCVHFFLPKPPANAKQRARPPVLKAGSSSPCRTRMNFRPDLRASILSGAFRPGALEPANVMPNRLERKSLGERARLFGNGGKTCKPRR